MPKGKLGWKGVLSKCAVFWNRIAVHHMRFQGSCFWYAVVTSLDGKHGLLTVRVPPTTFLAFAAKLEHATGQATFRDDAQGRFRPGIWVSDEFVRMIPEHLSWLTRDFLSGGHPMQLVEQPAKYRRGNYRSHPMRTRLREHRQIWRDRLQLGSWRNSTITQRSFTPKGECLMQKKTSSASGGCYEVRAERVSAENALQLRHAEGFAKDAAEGGFPGGL